MSKTFTRTLDPKQALSILKDFYLEVKKEIKKREQVQFTMEEESDLCGALHFKCDGFDLSFIVKEGGSV